MRAPRTRVRTLAIIGVLALGLAACGGGGDDVGSAADVDADVSTTGTDGLKFDPDTLEASAGEISVALTSESGVNHDFVVDDETVVDVPRGQTDVGTIELEEGEYTFWCSIPGHRQAGMEGTLVVE